MSVRELCCRRLLCLQSRDYRCWLFLGWRQYLRLITRLDECGRYPAWTTIRADAVSWPDQPISRRHNSHCCKWLYDSNHDLRVPWWRDIVPERGIQSHRSECLSDSRNSAGWSEYPTHQ